MATVNHLEPWSIHLGINSGYSAMAESRPTASTVQLNAVTVAWRSILVEDCEDPIYENTPISRA
jgi:hypothetical protein